MAVEVDEACGWAGERANAFVVANRDEPVIFYRKALLRCELSVNGYNFAVT